jgi:hypothetical protein
VALPSYTIGDDIAIEVRPYSNMRADGDFEGASILAGITTLQGELAAGTEIVAGEYIAARGVIRIEFPAAITSLLTPGVYQLETQKQKSGLRTTYSRTAFRMSATALQGDAPDPPVVVAQLDFTSADNAIFTAIL